MPIDVTIHDDGKRFTLREPIIYPTADGTIVVPIGFVTDFASIPRFLWSIYPPTGRYQRAAVLHDWLYVSHYANRSAYFYSEEYKLHEHPSTYKTRRVNLSKAPFDERDACDRLFLQAMKESGVSRRTRYSLYYAVRLFAGPLWKSGTYTGAV